MIIKVNGEVQKDKTRNEVMVLNEVSQVNEISKANEISKVNEISSSKVEKIKKFQIIDRDGKKLKKNNLINKFSNYKNKSIGEGVNKKGVNKKGVNKEGVNKEGVNKEDKKLIKFTNEKFTTFQIKYTMSARNEKVELMLNGLAENYKQPVDIIAGANISKEGIYIPKQEVFSFETVLGKDKMDQYITIREKSEDYAKQQMKFAWFRSPVTKIQEDIVDQFKDENSIGIEMKLKHLNVFPLTTDKRKENGILRDLLESAAGLKKGEKVLIQCSLRPAELSWWKDGEVALNNLSSRQKKRIGVDNLKNGNKNKLSMPVFDTFMRVIVKGSTKERSELLYRSFMLSLKQMDDINEWKYKVISDFQFNNWFDKKVKNRLTKTYTNFKRRDLLSAAELSMLIRLPNRNLQKEFELESDGRDELRVPKPLRGKNLMPIGHAEISGKKYPVGLPDDNLDDFMKSYCFIGSPRTGKDTSMINFIVEAAKRGHGALIPDAINETGNDRGMADSIRDALPPEKIVDVSLDDYNFPIYFGLDDIIDSMGENGVNLMADNLIKILKLDDKYESKKLTRLVAKACRCNLYDMYCFVRSEKYQLEVLKNLREEDELLALQLEHEYINAKVSSNIKGAILSRLDEMMGNDLLKYMFAQEPNNKIDFKRWIKEGKVIIFRMTKTDIGELGTQVLMFLLTIRLFWIKKMMNKDNFAKDKTIFLVFNEFFQYMSPGLESTLMDMIVECPKYRLGMLFAFHAPTSNQITPDFWNTLRAASLNYFLFKNTNSKVYTDMSEQLKPMDLDSAMKTDKYESIFIAYVDKKQHDPFFVKMLPPPKMRQKMYDNSNLTEEHKRKYGTELSIVKERIMEREMSLYVKEEDEEDEE